MAVSNWSEEGGGGTPLFDQLDEGIAGADSSGVKTGAISGSAPPVAFTLSAPPGDLADGSVTAVTINLRHKQSGRTDDTMAWGVALRTSAGVQLAGADSGTTTQDAATASPYRTTYGNNGAVSFTFVKTDASAAQWADAQFVFNGLKLSVKGSDTVTWSIDTFDIVITYTPTAAPTLYGNPTFHLSLTGGPEWALPTRSSLPQPI